MSQGYRGGVVNSYLLCEGPIWTGDPAARWAQAVVVRGTDLVHVETRDGAGDFIDRATELIDLGGRMCLPGMRSTRCRSS